MDEDFFMRADKVSDPWDDPGNTTKESWFSGGSIGLSGGEETPGWKQLEWLEFVSRLLRSGGHQVFVVIADYGHVWRIK